MTSRAFIVAVAGLAVSAACVSRLPDQDRRILVAAPFAKLSTDDLARDYDSDARAAGRKYHGKAVDVSGKVSGVLEGSAPGIKFDRVRAILLEDQAAATVRAAAVGQRMLLRCFVEGLSDKVVVLKSCIKP